MTVEPPHWFKGEKGSRVQSPHERVTVIAESLSAPQETAGRCHCGFGCEKTREGVVRRSQETCPCKETGSCTVAASAVRLNHFPVTFRLTIWGFQARIIPVTTLEIERFQRFPTSLVPRYTRQKCFCCGKEGTLCLSRSAA